MELTDGFNEGQNTKELITLDMKKEDLKTKELQPKFALGDKVTYTGFDIACVVHEVFVKSRIDTPQGPRFKELDNPVYTVIYRDETGGLRDLRLVESFLVAR